MSLNPTLTVLSTLTSHRVRHLLMGGQACMLYGAVQFSRDTDIAVLAEPSNLERLRSALDDLQAVSIALPPFEIEHLERGHAVHFRCQRPDLTRLRVDVMSKMRGVAPFDELWARRTTMRLADEPEFEMIGLADLVQAKKTQRLKDWPMLVQLVESHYRSHVEEPPAAEVIDFWLRECRTVTTLRELVTRFPDASQEASDARPLLRFAISNDPSGLEDAIQDEWALERAADREYWRPLRAELEQLRAQRGRH